MNNIYASHLEKKRLARSAERILLNAILTVAFVLAAAFGGLVFTKVVSAQSSSVVAHIPVPQR